MRLTRIHTVTMLALLLLALGGVALLLSSPSGPRFPGEGELEIDLPTLRVPSPACYEAESHRMLLLTTDYSDLELRLTWDPGGGEGMIREIGPYADFPRVGPDRPAALVLAGSMDLDGVPLGDRSIIGASRVYLGGLDEDGNIGAVPFQAHPEVCDELYRLGAARMPRDPEGNLVHELRIIREGDRVRYRWGPAPFLARRDIGARFSGGDASFTAAEVAGPGTGPLLPALAEYLARERPGENPMWKIVLLETGSGVRYVDILRAVECAPGDPLVTFDLHPDRRTELELLTLPTPLPDGASALGEVLDVGWNRPVLVIYALPDGALMVKGKEQTLETLREYAAEFAPEGECLLRIDRGNLVKGVLPVLDMLRAAGLRVFSCMKPVDPALGIETIFPLPPPDPDQPAVDVRLTRAEGGLRPDRDDVEGRSARVLLPDDARIEETLNALIRLKMAGATGFAFD